MTEPSFLGIAKSQWDMVNGFANWFAAAGSFTAAWVALYIANRAAKPSARCFVGHRVLVEPGQTKPPPEVVAFRITNTGDRPITITMIGWEWGLFRKRYADQIHDYTIISSKMPVELTHGQEAVWYIPLYEQDKSWTEHFSKNVLLPSYRISLWTLKARFYSSTGYVFSTKPEEGLIKRLRAAAEKVSKQ